MPGKDTIFLALLLGTTIVLSVALKKLTLPGALTGGLIGLGVYMGAGFTGIAMLGTFFILGTVATGFKQSWKEKADISKKNEGRRTGGQVLANGGMAGIAGIAVLLLPQHTTLLQAVMAAALSSATADTLSSELGVVYGRRFYNIRTLKSDMRGRDGVVSWEGTLIGLAGSIAIALVHAIGFGLTHFSWIILVAGTVGNLSDSLLGATLERRHLLSNNAVNFLNTFIAALVVLIAVLF